MKKRIFAVLIGMIVLLIVQMGYAESMTVNVASSIAGDRGVMSLNTSYSSVINNGFLVQNRYEFEAHEMGGECSINHIFGVAPSSDIEATLEIQMTSEVIQPGVPVYLSTEEKIGTGLLRTGAENQVEKFTGAIGSALNVINVNHASESYTNNGEVGHSVISEGQGLVKTGIIGHYYLYQGPEPEENGGMHPQICPWGHGVELVELANQSFEERFRYRGEYSYEFIGVIGAPPIYSP